MPVRFFELPTPCAEILMILFALDLFKFFNKIFIELLCKSKGPVTLANGDLEVLGIDNAKITTSNCLTASEIILSSVTSPCSGNAPLGIFSRDTERPRQVTSYPF